MQPFVTGERQRDLNNFSPRVGFAWSGVPTGLLVRGGYGIYYDRIVLQIQSLERGLDGRALPIEVRAGNVFFLDPATGRLPPFAPTLANPFTGFILPGAGASGINIIDPHLQNPTVHEFHLGVEARVRGHERLRVDGMHNQGVNFLIGRTVGEVFNPVVGGPDRVVNIESSARTKYDALLLSAERQFQAGTASARLHAGEGVQLRQRRSDSVPQRSDRSERPAARVRADAERPAASLRGVGQAQCRRRRQPRGAVDDLVGRADGHHDARRSVARSDHAAQRRRAAVPHRARAERLHHADQRDRRHRWRAAAARRRTARDSTTASTRSISACRRPFRLGARLRVEPMLEVFNLFNMTNILGVTNVNYSGFANVLVRDSDQAGTPGFLRSSAFGQPVTTAGGVFGSGGPRAMQFAARVTF